MEYYWKEIEKKSTSWMGDKQTIKFQQFPLLDNQNVVVMNFIVLFVWSDDWNG